MGERRVRSRQGQISVEYIMIVAFTFVVLIPGIYFFYAYSQSSSTGLASAQYNKLGQEMLSTALRTAAQGEGSWLTLDTIIPETVQNVSVNNHGSEIVIVYTTNVGPTEAVFFSDINLSTATDTQTDGTVFTESPHAGRAAFRFIAGPDGLVAIKETGGAS